MSAVRRQMALAAHYSVPPHPPEIGIASVKVGSRTIPRQYKQWSTL